MTVAKRACFLGGPSLFRAVAIFGGLGTRPDGTRTICRRRFSSLVPLNGNIIKMIMINRAIALHSRRWRVRAATATITTAYKIIVSTSRKTGLGITGDPTTTMAHNGDFSARRIRLIYYSVATGGSLFPGRRKQSAQVKHEYGTQQPPLLYIILLSIIIHATMMTIIMIIINVTRSTTCGGFFTHLSCTQWRPWWNDIFLLL